MKLRTILLKNYRLIEDAKIQLETGARATVLVGPNNSGKTSVVEAISAFLSGATKSFAIGDFSVRTHGAFNAFEAAALAQAAANNPAALPSLPSIQMEMHFEYQDTPEDLNVADTLLMDLNEALSEIRVRIELHPRQSEELALAFKAFRAKDARSTLRDFLTSRLSTYYELRYAKVAQNGDTETIAQDVVNRTMRRLIRVDFLPAQRHMEDQEGSAQATKLSRLLNIHYENRYKSAQPDTSKRTPNSIRSSSIFRTNRSHHLLTSSSIIHLLRQSTASRAQSLTKLLWC